MGSFESEAGIRGLVSYVFFVGCILDALFVVVGGCGVVVFFGYVRL